MSWCSTRRARSCRRTPYQRFCELSESIVAGDKHQLPPTSFFTSVTADEDDGRQVVQEDGTIDQSLTQGFESILDVLAAVLGGRRVRSLTWHYRSHDERLIAFSKVGSMTDR